MNIIFYLCSIGASAVSLYSFLCFIRIIITWFPQIAYSKFGYCMAAICDPYLDLFKRTKFLRIGALDFSPIIAISVLALATSILNSIAALHKISIGIICAMVIKMGWSIASSLLIVIIIVLVIRLIAHLLNKDMNTRFWDSIDNFFAPAYNWIRRFFFKGQFTPFRTPLITMLAGTIFLYIASTLFINLLVNLLASMPF